MTAKIRINTTLASEEDIQALNFALLNRKDAVKRVDILDDGSLNITTTRIAKLK